ncbi:MAG: hypothetical protein RBR99_05680, partial [Dehalococcoidales bacterium]|nr:hypothetical protein [Dehalococcoidales bacterium]
GGLLIIISELLFSFSASWANYFEPGLHGASSGGYFVVASLGYSGTVLALTGSFISRPKFYGISSTVLGIVYIYSFYGIFPNFRIESLIFSLIPGLALVVGGIIQMIREKRGPENEVYLFDGISLVLLCLSFILFVDVLAAPFATWAFIGNLLATMIFSLLGIWAIYRTYQGSIMNVNPDLS